MVFIRGLMTTDGEPVMSFSGVIKKDPAEDAT